MSKGISLRGILEFYAGKEALAKKSEVLWIKKISAVSLFNFIIISIKFYL